MNIRMRNYIYFLLALIMAVQPVFTTGMTVYAQERTDEKVVKIAIISDIHYVVDKYRTEIGEAALQYSALTESRMEQEIDTILDVTLEQAAKVNPDVLLACGDLLSNGEYVGAAALADKLKKAKEMEGLQNTGIYVVNGNHDINNSYSVDFSDDEYWNAARVLPENFKTIFNGLGYGENDSYNKDAALRSVYTPPAGELAGGLSYVTEIAEGITLIVLDTGQYTNNVAEHYSLAQQTAGRISDGLLAWAVNQAKSAKEKGNLVLAMSHHALIPHDGAGTDPAARKDVDWYMSSFIIENSIKAANALADAGVTAILTGHTHASDIAKYTSPNGNTIYDIETAALCAYPTAWRILTIRISQTDDKKMYTFGINTKFIDKDFGGKEEKTKDWKIMAGENKGKTFADYGGSMQAYGKEKSIYHDETIKAMIDYMLRSTIYPMVKGDESLEDYLRKSIDKDAESLEKAITNLLENLPLDQPIDLTFEIDIPVIGTINLYIKSKDNGAAAHAVEDELKPLILEISTDYFTIGDVKINLKLLPAYAVKLVRQVDVEFDKPDWQKNNYDTQNVLLNNVVNALNDAVLPSLKVKLDDSDPESYGLNIYNDAARSWARGDEGLASEEVKAKREKWNELLQSDKFVSIIKKYVVKELLQLNDESKYPAIAKILETPFNADEQEELISFPTMLIEIIVDILSPDFDYEKFSPSDLIWILSWAGEDVLAAHLPESVNTFLKDNVLGKVAAMQLAYATDTNIPTDSYYGFRIIEDDPQPQPEIWFWINWNDDSNKDGIRPDSVAVDLIGTGRSVTLNDANYWVGSFDGLDTDKGYELKVETTDVISGEDTETSYAIKFNKLEEEDLLVDYYQITLTHTPKQEPSPIPEQKNVWFKIIWDDDSDKDGIRPDSVAVDLLNGKEVIGEPFIVSEDNNWFGSFDELDPAVKYGIKVETTDVINGDRETGYDITYRLIREDPLGDSYEITLTHTPNQPVDPDPHHIDFYWLNDRQLPGTGFSASRVTELRERPRELVYGTTGLTLQIPELGVTEAIMTVPEVDGEYPVEWLGSAIGLLEQSSLPGKGVSVLAGHNHLNSADAGPFLSLGSLEDDARVMVTDTRDGMQMYRVYGNYKIASNAFASIAEDVRENALVLITCEDESVDGGYLNRRVILAEPVGR